jgi:Luciferase-like monooxygenase
MIADHIVFPLASESVYPYTVDRKHPGGGDALETFSILGVVAGATERLRLVTSVLVLPYRNPVLTAKGTGANRQHEHSRTCCAVPPSGPEHCVPDCGRSSALNTETS